MKTSPKLLVHVATLAASALLVSGCISPQMKVTAIKPGPKQIEPGALQLFRQGESVPRPYEVVGIVSATGVPGGPAYKNSALKHIRREAAALGAEALVGYYEQLDDVANSEK